MKPALRPRMTTPEGVRGGLPGAAGVALLVALLGAVGCAGATERATRTELTQVDAQLAPLPAVEGSDTSRPTGDEAPVRFDGSLAAYQAYAFRHSPDLRATFEAWRAATYRPDKVRRMPEMMISYAGFIQGVETRVGPQRHKLGIQQWFPWPTKLRAAGEAEALAARSAQREFEAHALRIGAEVSAAYWRLWMIGQRRTIEEAEVELLRTLAELVRVRVEASAAGLSDLTQLNLRLTKAEDQLAGLGEEERAASAALVRSIGAPDGTATPVRGDPPRVGVPEEDPQILREEVAAHPRIEVLALLSGSQEERARASRADRYPSVGVGVDWIITGQALDPTMTDSGKDALIGMAALRVPLSVGAYAAGENEARAKGRMYRARALALRNHAVAEFERVMAELRDAERRLTLYETTMIPMAETSFRAVQASYQSGGASVAEILMAEREVLDLQLETLRARVAAATAWAALEELVGRPVSPAEGGG